MRDGASIQRVVASHGHCWKLVASPQSPVALGTMYPVSIADLGGLRVRFAHRCGRAVLTRLISRGSLLVNKAGGEREGGDWVRRRATNDAPGDPLRPRSLRCRRLPLALLLFFAADVARLVVCAPFVHRAGGKKKPAGRGRGTALVLDGGRSGWRGARLRVTRRRCVRVSVDGRRSVL